MLHSSKLNMTLSLELIVIDWPFRLRKLDIALINLIIYTRMFHKLNEDDNAFCSFGILQNLHQEMANKH